MPLRPPNPTDAAALAKIHIQAWRETYTGIMPRAFLDGLSLEQGTATWLERFNNPLARQTTVVATTENGEVVGFATSGPARNGELLTDGEVFAVNLLQKAKRKKLGAQLMLAMSNSLLAFEFDKVGLWVLEQNIPARAFYDRLGGRPLATAFRDLGGQQLLELGYVWPTVHELKRSVETLLRSSPSS